VVEIGAGLGTLTARLLATSAEVWAIERDRDLVRVLAEELADQPRLRLVEADAVKFDYRAAAVGVAEPPVIVGNLPYHLTAPLLFALLEHHAATGRWVVMVQREVADRLCAAPGSRRYGRITAALGRVRAIERVCSVSRGCFLPAPRVDSAVVCLEPRPRPLGAPVDGVSYLRLVRAAFGRRRKTLANALRTLAPRDQVLEWCARAGIDPRVRPEQVAPEGFAALVRAREEHGEGVDA
jgi:16S rRNA (adenine1518-N6/adenine1519-N6)-dimethyltransferase